uniref:Uncharacterized protein n=1 Tax=Lactuca sativa TaxID=4236 RepID=A0A9R1UWG6_LACSA|nr:hypothetical protein LSAT_V11C700377570 [Lactuca sativa]
MNSTIPCVLFIRLVATTKLRNRSPLWNRRSSRHPSAYPRPSAGLHDFHFAENPLDTRLFFDFVYSRLSKIDRGRIPSLKSNDDALSSSHYMNEFDYAQGRR